MDIDNPAQFNRSNPFSQLQDTFQQWDYLDVFIQALDGLNHPEKRFEFYSKSIREHISDSNKKNASFIKYLTQKMWNSCFSMNKCKGQVGNYNRKFIDKLSGDFEGLFGREGARISSMDEKTFQTNLRSFNEKIQKHFANQMQAGLTQLSTFSNYLSDYQGNPEQPIEIPGQYHGESEPIHQVFIGSFSQDLLTLDSIRKPKRLKINGSDEKEYLLLVKGGEDLRLDQRIQQLFGLMNRLLNSDCECRKRELSLKVFQVVPILKSLGIVEWVNNTNPLKIMIQNQLKKDWKIENFFKTDAHKEHMKWLSMVGAQRRANNFADMCKAALGLPRHQVAEPFSKNQELIPWDLLKKSLQSLCSKPDFFVELRTNFIRSLATLNACAYILGIGDRHLDNFLLDLSDGRLLAIDFGVAFGNGLSELGIPELMPFRLTRQFLKLMYPPGLQGEYRCAMIHCLRTLRHNKDTILDCCEVFIKEPLLDWHKNLELRQESEENVEVQDSWSMRKIQCVAQKLQGMNCAYISIQELQESTIHSQKGYMKQLKSTLLGDQNSMRNKSGQKYLTVEDQVDCLIEMASDPDILGRAWIGWSAYV